MHRDIEHRLLQTLATYGYSVSTDTRKDLPGSIYFGLRGENHDGNDFIQQALDKGAVAVVTDRRDVIQSDQSADSRIIVVEDTLIALQQAATEYRKKFSIPVIVIGGSNGKTTSKELLRDVLQTTYQTHATVGSLNNHIGTPLSILSMPRDTEIAVFEIGANHSGEHLQLLNIISPTHVVVTNNGMDHLEGFGSPEGARAANKEIYDWAITHNATIFVHRLHEDLLEDSALSQHRVLYPLESIPVDHAYETQLVGSYNTENIELACSIGLFFNTPLTQALTAIANFTPLSNRSRLVIKNDEHMTNVHFVVDCYNANPSSMHASLESFFASTDSPKGVILGDMLELGAYAAEEHIKTVFYVLNQSLDCAIFIGEHFKRALDTISKDTPLPDTYHWFVDSKTAKIWFQQEKFKDYTFLLKGSRGVKVEEVM